MFMLPHSIAAEDETESDPKERKIVVTASKRESSIKDLAFSVNAQTLEDIERAGATNIEEISRNIAGLTIQNLGPGQSQVAIRGVSAGQIVRDQPGVKEQVGVYLDESVISMSLFTPDLDLYDLNRVETLRGPQGTLFGSGSMGGTVRYISNQPDLNSFEGNMEASLSTVTDGEEAGHLKGMVNVPFANGDAAFRAVVYNTEYAGFIDALGENGSRKEDVNGGSRTGGRFALTWKPTENLTITPRVVFQEIDMDGFNRQEVFNLYANPYTTTRPAIQLGEREQYLLLDEGFNDETLIADMTIGWELDGFDVEFISSYTDRDILVSRDASALTGSVSVDLGFPDAAVLLPSNLNDRTTIKQDTNELRFSSNGTEKMQWLVGAFMANTERKYSQLLPTPGYDAYVDDAFGDGTSAAVANGFPLNSPYNAALPYDLEQFALFGEVGYDFTDKLNVAFGTRFYDYKESRRFTSGGLFANGDDQVDTTKSDGFTSRIMTSYDLDDTFTLNAQISEGFRLGGVNDPLNATLCNDDDLAIFGNFQNYKDETLTNYEVGFKANSGTWSANTALFYADIKNLQVTLDAGSCSSRISFNVPEAHSTGVEFELSVRPSAELDISLAGSVLNSEFDSTVVDGNGVVIGGVEKGNRLASVPKMQFSLASTYSFPFEVLGSTEAYMSASIQHIGDRYTQPSDQVAGAGNFTSGLAFGGASGNDVTSLDLNLASYETINLSAGFGYDSWSVLVFINNLSDENANLSFDRERGGRARLGFQTNQPRTIGVTFRKDFN